MWQLFTDWCAAVGETSVPAHTDTVARFIHDNPATASTQLRRVGAINAVHRQRGYPAPGRSQEIRELLNTRRRMRRERRSLEAAAAISLLPDTGWPTALFARRDAMILVLTGSGMSAAAISALRCGDVSATPNEQLLEVETADETLTCGVDLVRAGLSPVQIWRDWDAVRRVQHRLPSTRRVADLIEGKPLPSLDPVPAQLPLLVSLDRWGATPLEMSPLSAGAVATIAAGHLSGRAIVHKPLQRRVTDTDPEESRSADAEPDPVVLDPDVIGRGLEARRRASEMLDGVGDRLDEVEARADALLEELLELLEQQED